MKLMILGKNGQVGWELQRALQPLGEVLALDRNIDENSLLSGDVTNFSEITRALAEFSPDIVVNATAYTAVDKAETHVKDADLVNCLALEHLAKQCKLADILLVHYSTDYVFSGEGERAWKESDICSPANVYGLTKRKGEIALEESTVRFMNFRTSWVYGAHGNNFVKTMLKLAAERDTLNIIDDQIGSPTGAALIADITAHALKYYIANAPLQSNLHGHYHLAATGETSWYKYACFIFNTARKHGVSLKIKDVNAIKTKEYPTPAKRPLNSKLDTTKIQDAFKLSLPRWQQGVEHVIREIL